MKKSFLMGVAFLSAMLTYAQKQHLTLQPVHPKQGEKIWITYDPKGTPLESKNNIELAVYNFSPDDKQGQKIVASEVKLKNENGMLKGELQPDQNAAVLVFSFNAGETKDGNYGKGYIVEIVDKDNKTLKGTYSALNMIYDGYGKYIADIEASPDKAYEYAEKNWTEFPTERLKNMASYVQALYNKKKAEAEPEIKTILANYENDPKLEDVHYQVLARWHQRLKDKVKSDALLAKMKERFPNGNWKKGEATNAFYAAKTTAEKETALQNYLAAFPPQNDQEKMQVNYLYNTLASQYGAANDKRDLAKFKEYSEKLPANMKASVFNDVAWNWAEKDMEIEYAKQISEWATMHAKKEMTSPTESKNPAITNAQWEASRKNTYAMYADTYGFILYKQGKYKEAFPFIKEATVDIKKKADPEYNERWAMVIEKTESPAFVQKELEGIVREGKSTPEIKNILKNAYAKNNATANFDVYLADLEKDAKAKKIEEIKAKMVKYSAAGFKLKNTQGMEVSLASLKGKVVVVDFWATWCGPCVASFPGMQKAVNKYKDDKNVVFLFVDTWESGDDRMKKVTDFISNNKYTFNVLMDEEKNEQFTVVSEYKVDGIPTKFVIDGEGNVRFKSVGWGGSLDGLVDELSAMIELARNGK